MRRGWLRDFAALSPGQDAPLTTFTSRTHGASQIVGYNKAAMMFLMLRDLLGRETFDRALQAFWREQRFRIASWADLQRAFQTASGQDLHMFLRPVAHARGSACCAHCGSGANEVGFRL